VSRFVRAATMADANDVAALLTELGYPTSPEDTVELLDQLADDPTSNVHVAESEGRSWD
jgi:hypothetical protein